MVPARNKGPNRSSNEEVSPGTDRIPRVPALKRDYGKLPKELRSEKGKRSNTIRNDQESGPEGTLPSRERPSRTLLKAETLTPLQRAVAKRVARKG